MKLKVNRLPDGGGSVLEITKKTICMSCGGIAEQCISYVWRGTKRKDLLDLGYGASVRHYYTECKECGAGAYS